MDTLTRIEQTLSHLDPRVLEIRDDSPQHVGHTGNTTGGGHYALLLVCDLFRGMSRIARHQRIYAELGALMGSEIHALAIVAYTAEEFAALPSAGAGRQAAPQGEDAPPRTR